MDRYLGHISKLELSESDTTTKEYDKTPKSRKVFLEFNISQVLKQARSRCYFLSRLYPILLASSRLAHLTCMFMWMDIPNADYTTAGITYST